MDAIVANKRLPSKTVNQGQRSKALRGNELYPTPEVLTIALINSGESLPRLIWEPACGLGHMVRPLVNAGHEVYASDLTSYGWGGQMRQGDFLAISEAPRFVPGGPQPTAIITNPPFSLSDAFVRHGLKLCEKVIILNRLAFFEGKGRSDIIDGHLTRAYPLVERPPMMHCWSENEATGDWEEWTGKKAPSAMPVCWYVFERVKAAPTTLRRISWRNPGQVLLPGL